MKTLVASLMLLCGCGTLSDSVRKQAAFNTRCPPEQIQVVRFSEDRATAELNVCGERRVYQDVMPPGEPGQTWLDVTDSKNNTGS